jgi:hypothetical protein
MYGAIAGVGLLGAIVYAHNGFWIPLLIAAPMALVQFYFDARKRSRDLAPELCGALALGSVAASMALMAGWLLMLALALWTVLALRSVTAILYVRARLRLEHAKPANPPAVWIAHGLAFALATLLAFMHLLPWLACAAFLALYARSVWGLSRWRRPLRAQIVGMHEVVLGFVTISMVAVGYWFGL